MEDNLSAMRPVDKYILFREKYPVFFYRSFDIEDTQEKILLTFHFSVLGLADFAPQWTLPKPKTRFVISTAAVSDGWYFLWGWLN